MTAPYQLDQPVWHASTTQSTEHVPCPDCMLTGRWKITTPAGDEWEHDCLRCSGSGKLPIQSASPVVKQLTIGQVRTVQNMDGTKHEYMCKETGIGGGSVYRHDQLFATEEEATAVAALLANERREELRDLPWLKERITLSEYQLKDAKVKEADDRAYEAEHLYEQLLRHVLELDVYPVWDSGKFSEGKETGSISLTKEQVRGVKRAILWLCDKTAINALLDYEAEESK
jgi:hypothetical protein